jgi:hypothetical protein
MASFKIAPLTDHTGAEATPSPIGHQRPLAATRNRFTVMARPVRAIRHRTGLDQVALPRTSRGRAMTNFLGTCLLSGSSV